MNATKVLKLIDAARAEGHAAGYDAGLAKSTADFVRNVELVAAVGEDTRKQLDVWQAEAKRLAGLHADACDRLVAMVAERDRLQVKSVGLATERKWGLGEIERLCGELNRWKAERDRLMADLDTATAEATRLHSERNRVEDERERLTAEVERLTAERDRAGGDAQEYWERLKNG